MAVYQPKFSNWSLGILRQGKYKIARDLATILESDLNKAHFCVCDDLSGTSIGKTNFSWHAPVMCHFERVLIIKACELT